MDDCGNPALGGTSSGLGGKPDAEPDSRSFKQLFRLASRDNTALVAINQAGLVEKFTDALVWIFLPVYFLAQGLTLVEAGAIIAVYGLVWGGGQLVTGPLSDKIGRKGLIVWGMWLCGAGVLAIPLSQGVVWWSLEAGLVGLGMAMLYPNLGAAAGDFAPVAHRASVIGIYRFGAIPVTLSVLWQWAWRRKFRRIYKRLFGWLRCRWGCRAFGSH